MAARPRPTFADYAVIAISPALIMFLVGSLVFFLIEVFYLGQYDKRLNFIMAMFVMAAVLIARISIEQGRGYATLFAIPLAVVTAIATFRFVEFSGALRSFSPVINIGLIALIWWCADKLTWDSTVIDESQDASGQGLLDTAGLGQLEGVESLDGTSERASRESAAAPAPASFGSWLRRFNENRRRPHAPGVWVIYFSLAALPIFGFGNWFIPGDDLESRRYVFKLLIVYVGAALALLVTTSFLGLRRYLRQRRLEMPLEMSGVWIGTGAAIIVALLLICMFLPRRNPEYSVTHLPVFAGSPSDLWTTEHAVGNEGQQDPEKADRTGDESPPPQSHQPSQDQQSPDQPSPDQQSSQGESSSAQSGGGQSQSSGAGQSSSGSRASKDGQKSTSSSSSQSSQKSPERSPSTRETDQSDNAPPESSESQSPDSNSAGSKSNENQQGSQRESSRQQRSQSAKRQPEQRQGSREQDSEPQQPSGGEKSEQDANSQDPRQDARQQSSPRQQPGNDPEDQQSERAKGEEPARESSDQRPSPSEPRSSEPSSSKAEPQTTSRFDPSKIPAAIAGTVGQFLRFIYWVVVIAAVAFFGWRYRREIRQAISNFIESLRQWWESLFGRREAEAAAAIDPQPAAEPAGIPFAAFHDPFLTGMADQRPPAEVIRYSFEALEAWARDQGFPRTPEQTPHEFAQFIGRQRTGLARDAATLAELYARCAYGRDTSSRATIEHLRRLWLQLREAVA